MSDEPTPNLPLEVHGRLRETRRNDARSRQERRHLKEEIDRTSQRFEATKISINQTWHQLVLARGAALDRDMRRAALNLLEDTERARVAEEAETANRQRAEAAERATEARYRTLFESIDEAFCIIEVIFDERGAKCIDYRFVEVNPAFERHTQLANAVGRTMHELVSGYEEFWFETYGRIAITGEPARFENRAKALDRDYDVYAFRTGEPHEHKVAVLFRDITQRKRDQTNLALLAEVSQDLVRLNQIDETMATLGAKIGTYFHASIYACGEVDVEQDAVTVAYQWNRAGAPSVKGVHRISALNNDDFRRVSRQGQTYVVRDAVHDDRVDAEQLRALSIGSFVCVPLVRDGEWRFMLMLADDSPRDWRDDEIELLREIAARIWTRLERARAEQALRESRERIQLIVENAREYAILSLDPDRRITSWSAGAQRILGHSEMEALGQSGDLIFTEEDRANDVPQFEAGRARATGRAIDERWHVRKDGTRFWGSGVMMAMHDPEGAMIGFVKIFRDHTVERLAKQTLERSLAETQQARAEAEAAGRAKDQFLAVISHELRTPLTPVLLATELIEQSGDDNARTRAALDMIRRNVAIEARFIKDLLDVTRIGHGKFEIHPAPLDLHKVIERALTIVQQDCDEKQQRLTVALDAVQTTVSGDDARLEQVACNLLKNAAKFTPEAGRIELRTFNEEDRVVLEVADSGIGIDPSEQPRIFDAFAQANQGVTQRFGGLGLGLAIAKAIVDGHDGELRVDSPGRDQGSTFQVRLPLLRHQAPSA